MHVADRIVDLVRHAGGELADGGHLLRLHQLFLGAGQPDQGLPQLRVAALQFLLARMAFADVVEQDQRIAVIAGRMVVIDAQLQDAAILQPQFAAPATGRAGGAARLRRHQIQQRLQRFRILALRQQRERGRVGVQRAIVAAAQQHAIVHQLGERLDVDKGRNVRGNAGNGRNTHDGWPCARVWRQRGPPVSASVTMAASTRPPRGSDHRERAAATQDVGLSVGVVGAAAFATPKVTQCPVHFATAARQQRAIGLVGLGQLAQAGFERRRRLRGHPVFQFAQRGELFTGRAHQRFDIVLQDRATLLGQRRGQALQLRLRSGAHRPSWRSRLSMPSAIASALI